MSRHIDLRSRALERKRPHVIAALCFCALSCHSILARADASDLPPQIGYNYDEIEMPRTASVGGASRALSSSLSAVFENPANLPVSRVYHLGALAQIWPEARRQSYGAAAVDSITNGTVSAGLGATYNLQDLDGINRRWTDIRLAVAFPLSDSFSAGAGARYMTLTQDGQGPFGPSLSSGGLRRKNIVGGFTFDVGASLRPSKGLAISLVGNNLTDPGHGFQPLTLGGGVGYATDRFGVEGDLVADFTTWNRTTLRGMAGGEFLMGDHYPLRGGYRYDEGAKSHAVSIGLGYIDSKIALELAVRRVVRGETATTFVIGFTFHVEATGLTRSASDSF
jgi:opacity protein-like surface antigen